MGEFFDYLMRRKPLLLVFLAVFFASGLFSYHVFIKSQAVLDQHVAETDIIIAPETKGETWPENGESDLENTESSDFFTQVQDPRETVLIFENMPSESVEDNSNMEFEEPSNEEPETESLLGGGMNSEPDDAGAAQGDLELPTDMEIEIPSTGQTSVATSQNSHPVLATCVIALAVATICFVVYLLALHFLR